eukprot:10438174-Alexandrium_andersonii.AAC.1
MATPPGDRRGPAGAPTPNVDASSHNWASDISMCLRRAPREPDGNGYALGCLRFGSLGVRANDLLSTYPGGSDYLCPQQ